MKIRLALADDHLLVAQGIKSLLEDQEDIQLVGEAQNGEELLNILRRTTVDVALVDIDMPVKNGIETTTEINAKFPDTRVIILTMHDEKAMIKNLMSLGAHGYLLKNCGQDELLLAIRNVALGKKHFSGEVTMALLSDDTDTKSTNELADLTEREIEILSNIAQGFSNKEIGEKLFISHRTVDTHRTNLMKKLNTHNIAGLIRIAYRNNLIN
jgi:DNA-binding NarL/FixJ family response regulator